MALEIDWFFQHVDWLHLLSDPGLHRRRRLADQLDRPDHAVLPGALPRHHRPRHAAALAGAAAQAPGGARASCRAASAGRGSCRRAPRRWAASRWTRRSPSSVRRRSSTSSSSPTRSPSTSCRSSSRRCRAMIEDIMRREHPTLWRDLPGPARAGRDRPGAGPAAGRRTHGDRRDRRAHRPAARPEDHGDQPLPEATRPWWCGSSATSASRS